MHPLGAIAAYGLGAWVYDVVIRPIQAKDKAIEAAKRRGKPVLNVGAGTPDSSIRVSILGPVTWGDVNCDIAGAGYCTPQNVCHCDIHDIPYPDKHFGSVIATHVLEHVDDPQRALRELQRVSDEVFVVVPRWWGLHTWLQPEHKWYVTKDMKFLPLWQTRNPLGLLQAPSRPPLLPSANSSSCPNRTER